MPDLTDKSAKAYSDAYEAAIKAVVSRYPALSRLDTVEASSLLRDIDFEELFRTTYGMDKALEGLAVSFAKEIIVTPPPPALPSTQVLSTALQFQVDAANTQISQTASEIKKIMMNSILGKQSESQFAAALNSEALRPDQINSYVNQNLRTFHRTVEAQMAEANPQELYIWDGPLDDRTSDECTEMIAEGAMTYDEWQSRYGAYLNNGTHYGCRHTLQAFVQVSQLEDTKKARGVSGNPPEFSNAKTISGAEGWATKNIKGVKSVNYKGLPLHRVNVINQELSLLQEKYGRLGEIEAVKVVNSSKFAARMNMGKTLEISKSVTNSSYARSVAAGIDKMKPSLAGLVDHEIGHALTPPIFYIDGSGMTPFGKRLDLFFNANRARIKTDLTEYAATARHEFVAEAFAAREAGLAPSWVTRWMSEEGI